jgi:hypothetical protein
MFLLKTRPLWKTSRQSFHMRPVIRATKIALSSHPAMTCIDQEAAPAPPKTPAARDDCLSVAAKMPSRDSWCGRIANESQPVITLLAEFVEQRVGVLQVGDVEALGEPVVDFGEHRARLIALACLSSSRVRLAVARSVSADNLGTAPCSMSVDQMCGMTSSRRRLICFSSIAKKEPKINCETPQLLTPPKLHRALLWRAYHRDR